ncbi:MAG: dihydroorotase [Gammaproteobacteria bacterium]|nr:dihydroorotase [Gammaproteobacteria bacterium]
MNIIIRNGRLIDPANQIDALLDIYIAGGRITALGQAPEGFVATEELEARGHIVCPGLIDLQARLREPGQKHKGTIASESRAAAAAGITTLCCPPDTQPVIDTPAVAEQIRHRAAEAGLARVLPIGALTQGLEGQQLSSMQALQSAGCIVMGNARRAIANTLVQRRALEYAATLGLTVFFNSEDPWLGADGCVHEGALSTRLGLAGIPECAEVIAVGRDLMLVEQTGVRAHFGQLSSARAVEMIATARARGLPVSADVSAHQLFLTEMDVAEFDSLCHVRPPLRSQRDREGLRAALADGTISAICSDHQPHDRDAKLAPFAATEPGISALETLLPLTLRLVEEGVLGLADAIARLTSEPAAILGLELGQLGIGAPADLCIFDPTHHWQLSEAQLLSRGKNTPFLGWELSGKVRYTLLEGRIVHRPTAQINNLNTEQA